MSTRAKLFVVAFFALAGSLAGAQTVYQLGGYRCAAASRYAISSPYQFNCNGVPLLNNSVQVGSVQIENAGGWIQVHAPEIWDPQQYLESILAPVKSNFSLPSSGGPGNVVFVYQITDANNNMFHGVIMAHWTDKTYAGWHYPQLVTTPVDGTLTIEAGPLQ